jgi:hypothetical protein
MAGGRPDGLSRQMGLSTDCLTDYPHLLPCFHRDGGGGGYPPARPSARPVLH